MASRTRFLTGLVLLFYLQIVRTAAEEELMVNVQVEPTNIRGNPATETTTSPPRLAAASFSILSKPSSSQVSVKTTTTRTTTSSQNQTAAAQSRTPPEPTFLPLYPSYPNSSITSAVKSTSVNSGELVVWDTAKSEAITFVFATPYSPPVTTLVSGVSGVASASAPASARANYSRTLDGWETSWTGPTATPTSGGLGLIDGRWGWGWVAGAVVVGWMLG